jgi:raffinose synthase
LKADSSLIEFKRDGSGVLVKGFWVFQEGKRLDSDIDFKLVGSETTSAESGGMRVEETTSVFEGPRGMSAKAHFKLLRSAEGDTLLARLDLTNSVAAGSYEVGGFLLSPEGAGRSVAYSFSFDPAIYGPAFAYYNPLGRGQAPKVPPPQEEPYPPRPPDVQEDLQASCWSYPFHFKSLEEAEGYRKLLFMLIEAAGGEAIAILPLSGYGVRGTLESLGGIKSLFHGFLREFTPATLPGFVVSFSRSPSRAVERAFRLGLSSLNKEHYLRSRKHYPSVFKYLGWCSWNSFLRDVSESGLREAVELFSKRSMPFKMVLIDDGWHSVEEEKLTSFEPDRSKFPNGFSSAVEAIKKAGVRYVGAWLTLQGYWRGVKEGSPLSSSYPMVKGKHNDQLVPNPERLEGHKFYTDFLGYLKSSGVDFLKVDNQFDVFRYAADNMPVGSLAEGLHHALESSAGMFGLPILNCMANTPDCFFFWSNSNVARASMDYIPYWKDGAKRHILYCAYNSLWLSQVAWPDWDMFQTHDPYALVHAISRLLSGGPVYVTDLPELVKPELLRKMTLKDGRLPDMDMPAVPTDDCIFKDPYNEQVALKVYNTMGIKGLGKIGIVGAFNISSSGKEVSVRISPSDAGFERGRFVVYESISGKVEELGAHDRTKETSLSELQVALYVIVPSLGGLSPVGIQGLFIPPMGMESVERDAKRLTVFMKEPGTLVALSNKRFDVYIDGVKCRMVKGPLRNNTYNVTGGGLVKVRSSSRSVSFVVKG